MKQEMNCDHSKSEPCTEKCHMPKKSKKGCDEATKKGCVQKAKKGCK
jgi:hypothetical protein